MTHAVQKAVYSSAKSATKRQPATAAERQRDHTHVRPYGRASICSYRTEAAAVPEERKGQDDSSHCPRPRLSCCRSGKPATSIDVNPILLGSGPYAIETPGNPRASSALVTRGWLSGQGLEKPCHNPLARRRGRNRPSAHAPTSEDAEPQLVCALPIYMRSLEVKSRRNFTEFTPTPADSEHTPSTLAARDATLLVF